VFIEMRDALLKTRFSAIDKTMPYPDPSIAASRAEEPRPSISEFLVSLFAVEQSAIEESIQEPSPMSNSAVLAPSVSNSGSPALSSVAAELMTAVSEIASIPFAEPTEAITEPIIVIRSKLYTADVHEFGTQAGVAFKDRQDGSCQTETSSSSSQTDPAAVSSDIGTQSAARVDVGSDTEVVTVNHANTETHESHKRDSDAQHDEVDVVNNFTQASVARVDTISQSEPVTLFERSSQFDTAVDGVRTFHRDTFGDSDASVRGSDSDIEMPSINGTG
jgi:hypothetical protein